jgi:hypothetical protein
VHAKQIKALLGAYEGVIMKGPEEDGDLATTPTSSGFRPGLRRAGTLIRIAGKKDREKGGATGGDMRAADVRELLHPHSDISQSPKLTRILLHLMIYPGIRRST